MQVLLNTDRTLTASAALTARVEADVAAAIDRFGDRVTRVEVRLHDETSGEAGPADKRCVMAARVRGHPSVAVSAHVEDYGRAVAAASDRLAHALDSLLGRVDDRRVTSEAMWGE